MIILIGFLTLAVIAAKWLGVPELARVDLGSIAVVGGFSAIIWLLYKQQKASGNTYDVLDILLDSRTHRASLDAHVTLGFACLAAWWIISPQADKDKGSKIVDILMIFIIYRGAKQAVDAYRDKPTMPAPDQNVEQQVIVNKQPDPIPEAARAPEVPKLQPVKLKGM